MTRRLVIANQKGGVGKSTSTVNIAAGLAALGQRVLVVDLDPQGNSGYILLAKRQPKTTIYNVLIDGLPASQAIIPTGISGVDIIASNGDLSGAEIALRDEIDGQTRLRDSLDSIEAGKYDFMLIDTSPYWNLLHIIAFAAVTEVLIPVSISELDLTGLAKLESTVERARKHFKSDIHITGVFITKFDSTVVARDVAEIIKGRYKEKAFQTVIPRTVKFEEALSRGQSIITYAPDNPGAIAYKQLVEEVMSRGG